MPNITIFKLAFSPISQREKDGEPSGRMLLKRVSLFSFIFIYFRFLRVGTKQDFHKETCVLRFS